MEKFKAHLQSMRSMNSKISFNENIDALLFDNIKKPEVHFTATAYLKMKSLVAHSAKEIAWHGIVKKTETGNYLITDILVYPQTVTGVTVTTDQVEYQNWLFEHPDEVFNNIRMQGHSHVNMGVTPSGVDDALYESILEQLPENDYYIFMIANKSGDLNVMIHDLAQNVIFEKDDVAVKIYMANGHTINSWITQVMSDYITERVYTAPAVKSVGYGYNYDQHEFLTERGYQSKKNQ